MYKKIITVVSAAMLTSCATVSHIPMNKQNQASIKSISVNPSIKKPAQMYDFAAGSEFGFAFGAIGGLAAGAANEKAGANMQKMHEKNKIDIQHIVYAAWQKELANKSRYKLKSGSNTVLTTDIVTYGISIPHGFSTDYVPVLSLNAKLVRDNKILWQDSGRVLPMTSGMPRYKMDEIKKDPQKLQVMWNAASVKIIDEMIQDMNQ